MDKIVKKRIALITTWFPPQKSVATNRMEAFAKYLADDFEVEIFGLNSQKSEIIWNDNVLVHYNSSNTLFDKLKSNQSDGKWKHKFKTLLRVILMKLSSNPLAKWKQNTKVDLVNRHKLAPFDVIISSYAPIEPHLIAAEMVQEFPSLIWVADMRDEMSKNPGILASQLELYKSVESLVNQYATIVSSVSKPIVEDFSVLCPNVKSSLEVRNGYDHDFQPNSENKMNGIFTLGYFGSFYGVIKPDVFFQALVEILNDDKEFDFELNIVGAHNNFNIPEKILSRVNKIAPLKYADAIESMAKMDCNVLINPRSARKGVYTGKLFDYISVQRSVLALVDTDDVAAQLVSDFDAGYIAECSDIEDNKKAILAAYKDWQNQQMKTASIENIQSLHRSHQVKILSDQLKKLLN
jgi:hypothetical protein